MAITMNKPRRFKQPNPLATASGGMRNPQPPGIKNPPAKSMHATKAVPQHQRTDPSQVDKPDYKPAASKGDRTKTTMVAGPSQGNSDVNSEAIGSLMGPASGTPAAFKSKKPKAKQMPFYGNLMGAK